MNKAKKIIPIKILKYQIEWQNLEQKVYFNLNNNNNQSPN